VLFNQVTDILHWGIPEHWRRRFKLKERRDNMRGFEAGYRVVLRLLHSVLREIDPSPLPKNRRLLKSEVQRLEGQADPALLQHRSELLQRVADVILESSIASVRHRLDDHWDGSANQHGNQPASPAGRSCSEPRRAAQSLLPEQHHHRSRGRGQALAVPLLRRPRVAEDLPRLRNSVEGFNGYAKDDAHEAIERAQNRRIRGIAAQTFLLAFQLAAANLRKISSWLDGLATDDGGPRRRARRRKTRSLSEFAPSRRLDDAA
jgi:hypothetical protein